ncbi:MAG TPA: hypothetical protein QF353_06370 [Gammaproteobacteria bacterium]|nr:hypothetical protein [Gammaproteobacteria bacterium]
MPGKKEGLFGDSAGKFMKKAKQPPPSGNESDDNSDWAEEYGNEESVNTNKSELEEKIEKVNQVKNWSSYKNFTKHFEALIEYVKNSPQENLEEHLSVLKSSVRLIKSLSKKSSLLEEKQKDRFNEIKETPLLTHDILKELNEMKKTVAAQESKKLPKKPEGRGGELQAMIKKGIGNRFGIKTKEETGALRAKKAVALGKEGREKAQGVLSALLLKKPPQPASIPSRPSQKTSVPEPKTPRVSMHDDWGQVEETSLDDNAKKAVEALRQVVKPKPNPKRRPMISPQTKKRMMNPRIVPKKVIERFLAAYPEGMLSNDDFPALKKLRESKSDSIVLDDFREAEQAVKNELNWYDRSDKATRVISVNGELQNLYQEICELISKQDFPKADQLIDQAILEDHSVYDIQESGVGLFDFIIEYASSQREITRKEIVDDFKWLNKHQPYMDKAGQSVFDYIDSDTEDGPSQEEVNYLRGILKEAGFKESPKIADKHKNKLESMMVKAIELDAVNHFTQLAEKHPNLDGFLSGEANPCLRGMKQGCHDILRVSSIKKAIINDRNKYLEPVIRYRHHEVYDEVFSGHDRQQAFKLAINHNNEHVFNKLINSEDFELSNKLFKEMIQSDKTNIQFIQQIIEKQPDYLDDLQSLESLALNFPSILISRWNSREFRDRLTEKKLYFSVHKLIKKHFSINDMNVFEDEKFMKVLDNIDPKEVIDYLNEAFLVAESKGVDVKNKPVTDFKLLESMLDGKTILEQLTTFHDDNKAKHIRWYFEKQLGNLIMVEDQVMIDKILEKYPDLRLKLLKIASITNQNNLLVHLAEGFQETDKHYADFLKWLVNGYVSTANQLGNDNVFADISNSLLTRDNFLKTLFTHDDIGLFFKYIENNPTLITHENTLKAIVDNFQKCSQYFLHEGKAALLHAMFTEATDHGVSLYNQLESRQKDQLMGIKNELDQSIVHLAASMDYHDVLQLMPNNAQHIAELFRRDINQKTPLEYASDAGIIIFRRTYQDLLKHALEETVDNQRSTLFHDLLEHGWSPLEGNTISLLNEKIEEQTKHLKKIFIATSTKAFRQKELDSFNECRKALIDQSGKSLFLHAALKAGQEKETMATIKTLIKFYAEEGKNPLTEIKEGKNFLEVMLGHENYQGMAKELSYDPNLIQIIIQEGEVDLAKKLIDLRLSPKEGKKELGQAYKQLQKDFKHGGTLVKFYLESQHYKLTKGVDVTKLDRVSMNAFYKKMLKKFNVKDKKALLASIDKADLGRLMSLGPKVQELRYMEKGKFIKLSDVTDEGKENKSKTDIKNIKSLDELEKVYELAIDQLNKGADPKLSKKVKTKLRRLSSNKIPSDPDQSSNKMGKGPR